MPELTNPKHTTRTRRQFIQTATAAAAILSSTACRTVSSTRANSRINLGVIGIGPRCRTVLDGMLPWDDVRCVAIADVQASRRSQGKQKVDDFYGNKDCVLYHDFRDLLAREDIDAVLIATGDRWHSSASILAAEAGKDVYSEKPCGITIDACQKLETAILKQGRVFQAGTQRRSILNFQKAIEIARSGKLGKIHTMHASIYEPVLQNTWLPAEPQPEPEVCDWNMWLGPAAWRPYNQQYVNGRWRREWDFDSGGALLDWGAHTLDLCQAANNADDTMPVEYEPHDDKIICRYANGVKLVLDFLKTPFGDRSPHYITRLGTCPVRFVGDEGWVETGDSGEIVVNPSSRYQELVGNLERVNGLGVSSHARDFFDAIRSRGTTRANATVMRRSHIACHAAAISWILGRTLRIDPNTDTFINDSDANGLRSRPDRDWMI